MAELLRSERRSESGQCRAAKPAENCPEDRRETVLWTVSTVRLRLRQRSRKGPSDIPVGQGHGACPPGGCDPVAPAPRRTGATRAGAARAGQGSPPQRRAAMAARHAAATHARCKEPWSPTENPSRACPGTSGTHPVHRIRRGPGASPGRGKASRKKKAAHPRGLSSSSLARAATRNGPRAAEARKPQGGARYPRTGGTGGTRITVPRTRGNGRAPRSGNARKMQRTVVPH